MTGQRWVEGPLADLRGAIGLLTRLPWGGPGRGAPSAWAWPLAGAIVGGLAAALGAGALALGVPATVAAALILGALAVLTGGLHEDGLADSTDGLWGGGSKARRLEIMRDSRIGSYGVMGLLVVTLIRWGALVALVEAVGPGIALIGLVAAVAAAARAPMAAIMAALPPARGDGLSHAHGRPGAGPAALGAGIAGAALLVATGPLPALAIIAALGGVTVLVARLAQARIGGQTGDILGAAQQLGEAAALMVLSALIAG